jgi:hypothetical protein
VRSNIAARGCSFRHAARQALWQANSGRPLRNSQTAWLGLSGDRSAQPLKHKQVSAANPAQYRFMALRRASPARRRLPVL